MYILNFEGFIEETWDYVSQYVVSDDYWEANNEFIREVTFELYELYRKNLIRNEDGSMIERITTKDCGKMMEAFFSVLKRYQSKIINTDINPYK